MANKRLFQTKQFHSVCQKPPKLGPGGTNCQWEEVMAIKVPLRILHTENITISGMKVVFFCIESHSKGLYA